MTCGVCGGSGRTKEFFPPGTTLHVLAECSLCHGTGHADLPPEDLEIAMLLRKRPLFCGAPGPHGVGGTLGVAIGVRPTAPGSLQLECRDCGNVVLYKRDPLCRMLKSMQERKRP